MYVQASVEKETSKVKIPLYLCFKEKSCLELLSLYLVDQVVYTTVTIRINHTGNIIFR